jgi:CheY-like chemotaxis protein
MSHELRTPLNAIMGFAQLLNRDKSISPQQQHYINTINRSGQHLLELINDVLEVSKIEAGKTVLNTSSFDLYQLLNTLEELFRPKAIAKKLILTIERSRTTPLYIHTDEHKLRQVLINLLGNAVKFTHTGRITLRVQELDPVDCPPLTPMSQMLYFEIQDTGVGIASADLPKLFKPFSQTQSGREAGEGTGLGLVISRHFVELMGGELGVYNTLGEGSTFWFTIQVQFVSCDLLPTPIQTQRVIGLEPHQPTYRILIVEDQAENAEFLQQLLTSVGFETMQARQGQEGISLWKIWQPHLILMDMQMPVMDGYTTSRLIKSTPEGQRTKIIAVTGSAFEEDRDRILAIGCDDFIRKPVSESLLFAKIAQHLGARFCYEAVELDGETAVQGQLWPLSQDALHVMPIDWVTALNQAARECHEPAVFQLLQQIPTEHETLAIALKQLAIDFRFEEMANLTNGAGR